MNLSGKSVLMVDDDEIIREVLEEALAPFVSALESASSGAEALARIIERDFDIILLDMEMPGMNGMDFCRHLGNIKPHLVDRVIFITGDAENPSSRDFIRNSASRCLVKPFMIRDLFNIMGGL